VVSSLQKQIPRAFPLFLDPVPSVCACFMMCHSCSPRFSSNENLCEPQVLPDYHRDGGACFFRSGSLFNSLSTVSNPVALLCLFTIFVDRLFWNKIRELPEFYGLSATKVFLPFARHSLCWVFVLRRASQSGDGLCSVRSFKRSSALPENLSEESLLSLSWEIPLFPRNPARDELWLFLPPTWPVFPF